MTERGWRSGLYFFERRITLIADSAWPWVLLAAALLADLAAMAR